MQLCAINPFLPLWLRVIKFKVYLNFASLGIYVIISLFEYNIFLFLNLIFIIIINFK